MVGALSTQEKPDEKLPMFEESRRAWEFQRKRDETEELTGFGPDYKKSGMWESDLFTKTVGHRPRGGRLQWWAHYPDE